MPKLKQFDIGTVVDTVSVHVPAPPPKPIDDDVSEKLASLMAAMSRSIEGGDYTLRMDMMSSGHVRVYRNEKLQDPAMETPSFVAGFLQRKPELFSIVPETLSKWGFSIPAISEKEACSAEESMYRTQDPKRAALIAAQLFDAQLPLFSNLFNRLDDRFYGTLDLDFLAERLPDYWRATNVQDMADSAFGFRRKDLAKLIATSSPVVTIWLSMFAEHLTEDQIVRAYRELSTGEYRPVSGMPKETVDEVMATFPHPTSRFNLAINRDKYSEDMYFENGDMSVRLPNNGGLLHSDRKIRGWGDVARQVMVEYVKAMGDDGPTLSQRFSGLDGCEQDGYTMFPLTTGMDLIATGDGMSVCVGRMHYQHRIEANDVALIRLDRDGQMMGLAEFEHSANTDLWRLAEFKGRSNDAPPSDFDAERLTALVNEMSRRYDDETNDKEHDNGQLSVRDLAA